MRCLVLEPGYCPYVAIFRNSEEAIRQVLKDTHKVELPFENDVIALVYKENQEGKAHNRTITENLTVSGCALICGWNGDSVCGLTREQANRYNRRYLYPEKRENTPDGSEIIYTDVPRVKPIDERYGKKPNWLER